MLAQHGVTKLGLLARHPRRNLSDPEANHRRKSLLSKGLAFSPIRSAVSGIKSAYQQEHFAPRPNLNEKSMRYQHVCVESLGYKLPEEVLTSDMLEEQLAPLYKRLRLPAGRLELMTGIRERRLWERDSLPSDHSIESCRYALEAADIAPGQVGALIHASVCRDHLEPATASRVNTS